MLTQIQINDRVNIAQFLRLSPRDICYLAIYYDMPLDREGFNQWIESNPDMAIKAVSGKFSSVYYAPDPKDHRAHKVVRRRRYQCRRFKMLYPYRPRIRQRT